MTMGDGGGGSEEGGNGSLKNNRFLTSTGQERLTHSKQCRFTKVECDSKEDIFCNLYKKKTLNL